MALSPDDEDYDTSQSRASTRLKPRSAPSSGPKLLVHKSTSGARRRRTRCRKCEACLRSECGECHFCKDMKKFGGPGRMKQSCIKRQCIAPVLPHTAVCKICGEAGKEDNVVDEAEKFNASLMECSICNEILHPGCLKVEESEGLINDELPNCWECPKCNQEGKTGKKRGPGFKFASNLPGSLLKEFKEGEDGGRRKSEDLGRPKMEEYHPNRRKSDDGLGLKRRKEKDLPTDLSPRKKLRGGKDDKLQKRKEKLSNNRIKRGKIGGDQPALKNLTDFEEQAAQLAGKEHNQAYEDGEIDGQPPTSSSRKKGKQVDKAQPKSPQRTKGFGEEEESAPVEQSPVLPSSAETHTSKRKTTPNSEECTKVNHLERSEDAERIERIRQMMKRVNRNEATSSSSSSDSGSDSSSGSESSLQRSAGSSGGSSPRSVAKADNQRSKLRRLSNDIFSEEDDEEEEDEDEENARNIKSNSFLASKDRENNYYSLRGESIQKNSFRTVEVSLKKKNGPSNQLCHKGLGGLARPQILSKLPVQSPPKPFQMERHVVRPPPDSPEPDSLPLAGGSEHVMQREVWLAIFRYLSHKDLCICMRVCKTWSKWCCDKRLWITINLSGCISITPTMLSGIIRRQPIILDLSWTNISKKQLSWLINKLQNLKILVLAGCIWSAISALCTASCPLLRMLDLRWVADLKDSQMKELLSPPTDCRVGQNHNQSKLWNLTEFQLAGLDITDCSLALMTRHMPMLNKLDLSQCSHVTDQSIVLLTAPGSSTRETLSEINLSGCHRITDQCLLLLKHCPNLTRIDLRNCKLISPQACQQLVEGLANVAPFELLEDKLLKRSLQLTK
ncbi:lysine-specific demethylase 2B-like isoform X1 [Scyliorhinus canicula]|uniref:lysine-specific demethylase 2B-like isoform X1 n=1 Tax=Scyliorhinus canicula TaxID=7830 RepID=UPI0018F4F3DE|nr:lysine-specific demethylase 2B-like isoform X1 [Scyliorhinus canicula]